MRATTNDNRKGPANADVHQQALKINRAATQTTRRKITTGVVDLPDKMIEAARETKLFEFPVKEGPLWSIRKYDIERAKRFFCTPEGAVLYKLGRGWIRVTEENLVKVGVTPGNARFVLKLIRHSCERTNKVGWVLPKLQQGGVA